MRLSSGMDKNPTPRAQRVNTFAATRKCHVHSHPLSVNNVYYNLRIARIFLSRSFSLLSPPRFFFLFHSIFFPNSLFRLPSIISYIAALLLLFNYRYRTIIIQRVILSVIDRKMGCFGSKDKLSKEDMDFLKSHTRYDEATIKEWYKGFKVSYYSKIYLFLFANIFFFLSLFLEVSKKVDRCS